MACQATNSVINKPYDDELCRLGLYNILECLLINERADCPTIIAISKDLIDHATLADSSIKVKETCCSLGSSELFSSTVDRLFPSGENGSEKIKIDLATSERLDESSLSALVLPECGPAPQDRAESCQLVDVYH